MIRGLLSLKRKQVFNFLSIRRASSVQIDLHIWSIELCFHRADKTELINSFVVVCNGSQNKLSFICFSFMYITNMGAHYGCQPQMFYGIPTLRRLMYLSSVRRLLMNSRKELEDYIIFSGTYWGFFCASAANIISGEFLSVHKISLIFQLLYGIYFPCHTNMQ